VLAFLSAFNAYFDFLPNTSTDVRKTSCWSVKTRFSVGGKRRGWNKNTRTAYLEMYEVCTQGCSTHTTVVFRLPNLILNLGSNCLKFKTRKGILTRVFLQQKIWKMVFSALFWPKILQKIPQSVFFRNATSEKVC
jgi:hypothetical protein